MDVYSLYEYITKEKLGAAILREPLSRHTTWRIGGPADLYFAPFDWRDCKEALSYAGERNIPVTVLGAGSNILVADTGIRGLVIHTPRMKDVRWEGSFLSAAAGAMLIHLSQKAQQKGFSGLEFACAIPGTVGGAIVMNAGAHGASMENVVRFVRTLTLKGEEKTYSHQDLDFSYRKSVLKNGQELVAEAGLLLKPGDSEEIKRRMDEYCAVRREKQPFNEPSAGSVFRNPPGDSAGRLIEAAGLKGLSRGDAMVSEKHGNFFVNKGKASAEEMRALIEEVRNKVYKEFHVELDTEVVLLGFEDNRR